MVRAGFLDSGRKWCQEARGLVPLRRMRAEVLVSGESKDFGDGFLGFNRKWGLCPGEGLGL